MNVTMDQALAMLEAMAIEAQRKALELHQQLESRDDGQLLLTAAHNFAGVADLLRVLRLDDDDVEMPCSSLCRH